MIVVTTAGTFLIESASRSDILKVRAQTEAPLRHLIDELELVGTVDNPTELAYMYGDIVEHEVRMSLVNEHFGTEPYKPTMPFSLRVHRADMALFLQAEVLNFLNYRLILAQELDEIGTRLRDELFRR